MIEKLFRRAYVRRRMAASRLGIILFDFARYLHERGHALPGLQGKVEAAEHFSRWMSARHLRIAELNETVVERFLRSHLPRCRCLQPAPRYEKQCRPALRQLLSFLRQRRLLRSKPAEKPSAYSKLLLRYDD